MNESFARQAKAPKAAEPRLSLAQNAVTRVAHTPYSAVREAIAPPTPRPRAVEARYLQRFQYTNHRRQDCGQRRWHRTRCDGIDVCAVRDDETRRTGHGIGVVDCHGPGDTPGGTLSAGNVEAGAEFTIRLPTLRWEGAETQPVPGQSHSERESDQPACSAGSRSERHCCEKHEVATQRSACPRNNFWPIGLGQCRSRSARERRPHEGISARERTTSMRACRAITAASLAEQLIARRAVARAASYITRGGGTPSTSFEFPDICTHPSCDVRSSCVFWMCSRRRRCHRPRQRSSART